VFIFVLGKTGGRVPRGGKGLGVGWGWEGGGKGKGICVFSLVQFFFVECVGRGGDGDVLICSGRMLGGWGGK